MRAPNVVGEADTLPEPYQSSFLNALQEVSPRQANKVNLPVTNDKGPWWVEVLWNDMETPAPRSKWVRSFAHQHFTNSGYRDLRSAHAFAMQIDSIMFGDAQQAADPNKWRFRIHFLYRPDGPPAPTVSYVEVFGLE